MPDHSASNPPDSLAEHSEFVRRLARRLVLDEDSADDVVQETMLAAIRHPPRKRGPLRPWLAKIARHAVFKGWRRDERRVRRERAAAKSEVGPSLESELEREAMLREVVDAVLALREPYRSTILLRFYENLPPREIAARQGTPIETVRSRLTRAIGQLRKRLDRSHGERESWCLALAALSGIDLRLVVGREVAQGVAWTHGSLLMSKKAIGTAIGIIVIVGSASIYELTSDPPPIPRLERQDASARLESEGTSAVPKLERAADASRRTPAADAEAAREGAGDPPNEPSVLTGRLVDDTTLAPIEGIEVELQRLEWNGRQFMRDDEKRPLRTTSDREGGFEVESIGEGRYWIDVGHRFYGHCPIEEVRIDRDVDLGTIGLAAGGVIAGRVTGADGSWAEDAHVAVVRAEWQVSDSTPEHLDHRGAPVREGHFEIAGLPVGSYRVQAVSHVDSPSAAQDIEVAAHQVHHVQLALQPSARLSGWVLDRGGRGVSAVRVRVRPFQPTSLGDDSRIGSTKVESRLPPNPRSHYVETDAHGFFEPPPLPAGRWELFVDLAEGGEILELVEVAPGDSVELELRAPDLAITGHVLDSEGEPIEEAEISASYRPTEGRRSKYVKTKTDASGAFELLCPVDGVVYSTVASQDGFVPQRHRLEAGASDVEIRLGRVASIRGRVILGDGAPAAEASVLVIRVGGIGYLDDVIGVCGAEADAEGWFHLPRVRPGAVELWAGGRRFGQGRALVDVAPGQELDGVVIEVERAGIVEGVVGDDSGGPVAGVRVDLRHGGFVIGTAGLHPIVDTTDPEGAYRLSPVGRGRRRVYVTADSYAPLDVEVRVAPGETLQRDFVLEPRKDVRVFGTVIGRDGEPVLEASVQVGHVAPRGTFGSDVTDSEGRFDMGRIQLGEYRLTAFHPIGRWKATLASRELVVPSDVDEVEIDLRAQPAGDTRLHGRVLVGDEPLAGVEVGYSIEVPIADDHTFYAWSRTDEEGRYELKHLPAGPGVIAVVAIQSIANDGSWRERAQVIHRLVDLPGTDEVEMDLELSGGEIRGRAPSRGEHRTFLFQLRREDDGHLVSSDQRDSQKVFSGEAWSFEWLEPGRYSLQVTGASHGLLFLPSIDVGSGQMIDLGELELGPSGAIAITVRSSEGQYVTGSTVVLEQPIQPSALRTAMNYGSGRSSFEHLPPGEYDIRIQHEGFRPARLEKVRVEANRTTHREVVLTPTR